MENVDSITKAELQLMESYKPLCDSLGVEPPIANQAKLQEELFVLRTELLIIVTRQKVLCEMADLKRQQIADKERQVERY